MMDWPIGQQDRRYLASVSTTTLGLLIAIYLAYRNGDLSKISAIGLALLSLLVALVGERVLTYGPLHRYRDSQLSTFFDHYLSMVGEDIEDEAANDVEVRVNIMRPHSGLFGDPTYKIDFWSDDDRYLADEFDLEFEIGEGCVGATHERQHQQFAVSPDHLEGEGDEFDVTEKQIEVADHLNTIIGTPIYRSNDDQRTTPTAVLIIDSEQDFSKFVDIGRWEALANTEFEHTDVAEMATEYARRVGILL